MVGLRALGTGAEGFADTTLIVVEKSRYRPSEERLAKGNRYGDEEIGSTSDSASLDRKSGANLAVTLELNGRGKAESFQPSRSCRSRRDRSCVSVYNCQIDSAGTAG